jgi:cellulose synthase/poly-beta-1,6-N-acetylglucosamine synthase-like glycosyltransferase
MYTMRLHKSSEFKFAKRRQWGAEKRLKPLPIEHVIPSTRKIALSRLAIVTTVGMWLAYIISTVIRQFFEGPKTFDFALQAFGYVIVVSFLTFSALLYLIIRQGALLRFSKHRRTPRAELERYFAHRQPTITVLVPSYAEETDVIRKTLLSAAIQEYPKKRVVLLVDDNPNPTSERVLKKLNDTRALGKGIEELFAEPLAMAQQALAAFEETHMIAKTVGYRDVEKLVAHYRTVISWLAEWATQEEIADHVDHFFNNEVILGLAGELEVVASALEASVLEKARISTKRIHQLYQRIVWIFDVQVEVFERKKFASLSHEANKAMNLNSYIGLMGGQYKRTTTPDGVVLLPVADKRQADLIVPDSDYLLTLDADSVLLRDYCLRLVYLLEQPSNARVAVTQTPYSSFRGARTRIERLAAATTDIQHILHQGMSHYNATFWVGANAIIRKCALEDIVETELEGAFEVKRYVQDRTVIEDTESSIDLAVHGWSLINYPERLSYSATPPDFGSLVVQRRRWANGGLLIMPKLIANIKERKRRGEHVSRMELLIRFNYMASIAWASFGLIFLLAFPYDGRLLSPFVVLAALPYFVAMASDLKYCGYKRMDVLRIYGFNLILLPVNLAGVLKSLQQALTGKKIPFARTPKVKNRTASPLLYVIAPVLIVAFSILTLWRDYHAGNWANAAFAGFNAVVSLWAIKAYIGIRSTIADTWLGLTKWLYVEVIPEKNHPVVEEIEEPIDWRAVLYHGHAREPIPVGIADYDMVAGDTERVQL